MNDRHLLISDPPHGDATVAEVASHFGLTATEVQVKANYGIPEIWFSDDHEANLQHTAAALEAAGLGAVLVAGSDLVEIPAQSIAGSFEFTSEGLQGEGEDSEWSMAYDAPTIGVFYRPRIEAQDVRAPARSAPTLRRDPLMSLGRGGAHRSSPGAGQFKLGSSPFLDLYTLSDNGPVRITIVPEIITTSLPQGLSAMLNLVEECENRFENVYLDRRLVDMRLRGVNHVVTGANVDVHRKGFSFATVALNHLLGLISPDLRDNTQADLSSRLAFLTNRSRIS